MERRIKAIFIGSVGNLVEWYDFYAYTAFALYFAPAFFLVVPHLYFSKSARWLQGIEFLKRDAPGYREVRGYHNRGDPWQEQRYSGD